MKMEKFVSHYFPKHFQEMYNCKFDFNCWTFKKASYHHFPLEESAPKPDSSDICSDAVTQVKQIASKHTGKHC